MTQRLKEPIVIATAIIQLIVTLFYLVRMIWIKDTIYSLMHVEDLLFTIIWTVIPILGIVLSVTILIAMITKTIELHKIFYIVNIVFFILTLICVAFFMIFSGGYRI